MLGAKACCGGFYYTYGMSANEPFLIISERFNLLALQQDDSFKSLDQTLQAFVNNLANGYRQLSDLVSQEGITTRSVIAEEHKTTRDHFNLRFEDMRLISFTEQKCKKFLESLYYPEIHQRQEQISDAHKQTFDFIFDRTGQGVRHWSNFVEWLETGAGIYWINGKVGSGKSTLMNYITTDPRTMDSLHVWSQSSPILTLTFFFWNAGTQLQKSSLGLFRSLLYQLLQAHHEVIPELAKFQAIPAFDGPMPVWTKKRLQSSLAFVINKISQRVCLFLDGLDEFDEGEEVLLELISDLQSRPSVKICLSSRPLQSYINAFEHSAQLKLQDLTRQAIESYVGDRLHADPRMKQLLQEEPSRGRWLISDVIDKADGIFLWVELAVKLLLTGLTNEDDWETMESRLLLLPKGIESLYIHMWTRLAEDRELYREEAALYFRVILHRDMSLLQFLVATNENLQSLLLDPRSRLPSIADIVSMCKKVEVRVLACGAGLLEADRFERPKTNEGELADHEDKDQDEHNQNTRGDDYRLIHLHKETRVRFIHRTARDFLLSTREGQNILLMEDAPPAYTAYAWIRSDFGIERLLPHESPVHLPALFSDLQSWQVAANDALDPLMDTVESYFSANYSSDVLTGPHWLRRYYEAFAEDKLHKEPATEFLGLAASFGVCLDMSRRFLQHPQRTDMSFTNSLLYSALCWRSPTRFRPQLVLMLLSDGADPNKSLPRPDRRGYGTRTSCWKNFLHILYVYQTWQFRRFLRGSTITTKDLFAISKAFLDNGADLHAKITTGYSDVQSGNRIEWYRGTSGHLVCEITTRCILTEVLRHDSQFSEIEKRFEDAGAEVSRKVLLAHHKGSYFSKPVSEQDSQYLLAAVDAYELEQSASTAMVLWDKIREVSTRDQGDECDCERCSGGGLGPQLY
jgi:NACHT domain